MTEGQGPGSPWSRPRAVGLRGLGSPECCHGGGGSLLRLQHPLFAE